MCPRAFLPLFCIAVGSLKSIDFQRPNHNFGSGEGNFVATNNGFSKRATISVLQLTPDLDATRGSFSIGLVIQCEQNDLDLNPRAITIFLGDSSPNPHLVLLRTLRSTAERKCKHALRLNFDEVQGAKHSSLFIVSDSQDPDGPLEVALVDFVGIDSPGTQALIAITVAAAVVGVGISFGASLLERGSIPDLTASPTTFRRGFQSRGIHGVMSGNTGLGSSGACDPLVMIAHLQSITLVSQLQADIPPLYRQLGSMSRWSIGNVAFVHPSRMSPCAGVQPFISNSCSPFIISHGGDPLSMFRNLLISTNILGVIALGLIAAQYYYYRADMLRRLPNVKRQLRRFQSAGVCVVNLLHYGVTVSALSVCWFNDFDTAARVEVYIAFLISAVGTLGLPLFAIYKYRKTSKIESRIHLYGQRERIQMNRKIEKTRAVLHPVIGNSRRLPAQLYVVHLVARRAVQAIIVVFLSQHPTVQCVALIVSFSVSLVFNILSNPVPDGRWSLSSFVEIATPCFVIVVCTLSMFPGVYSRSMITGALLVTLQVVIILAALAATVVWRIRNYQSVPNFENVRSETSNNHLRVPDTWFENVLMSALSNRQNTRPPMRMSHQQTQPHTELQSNHQRSDATIGSEENVSNNNSNNTQNNDNQNNHVGVGNNNNGQGASSNQQQRSSNASDYHSSPSDWLFIRPARYSVTQRSASSRRFGEIPESTRRGFLLRRSASTSDANAVKLNLESDPNLDGVLSSSNNTANNSSSGITEDTVNLLELCDALHRGASTDSVDNTPWIASRSVRVDSGTDSTSISQWVRDRRRSIARKQIKRQGVMAKRTLGSITDAPE